MADLEEAISMLREALSIGPAITHLHRILDNLACFLEALFEENGNQSDYEEAIFLRQEILAMSK